uniref:Uncharacterized protein n=1 Tax=Cannabis sativa TaxID=3483 RepID=A0A803QHW5_CANSA
MKNVDPINIPTRIKRSLCSLKSVSRADVVADSPLGEINTNADSTAGASGGSWGGSWTSGGVVTRRGWVVDFDGGELRVDGVELRVLVLEVLGDGDGNGPQDLWVLGYGNDTGVSGFSVTRAGLIGDMTKVLRST